MTIQLRDFFRYYDDTNPKHRAAIEELQARMPASMLEDKANWVRIYRTPVALPDAPTVTNWNDWSSKVSRWFTVGEAFQWDPYRRDRADATVRQNICRLARELDKLRERFGPLGVTSWYRDPETNRRVGGVSNSQHLTGGAADVYTLEFDAREFERWCEANWPGGVGRGQSSGRGFTHLDLGPRRVWDY
jgi:putative chitinase